MISHARENIPRRTYSLSKFVEEDEETLFVLLAKPKLDEDSSPLGVVVTQTAVSIASKASAAADRASSLP